MNENKKQVITKEIIQKELELQKQKYRNIQFKIALPRLIGAILAAVLLFILITVSKKWSLLTVLISLSCVLFAPLSIISMLEKYRRLSLAEKTSDYFITEDVLINKEKLRSNDFAEDVSLSFSKYGRTSTAVASEYFDNCDLGVYDAAKKNDTFYLIVRKAQILCVFNTRYFELDEELQKELRN